MAATYQSRVGLSSDVFRSDGNVGDIIGGTSGEYVTERLHGRELLQNIRGNSYILASSAGFALPAQSATTQKFMLWNPAGNRFLFRCHRIAVGLVSVQSAVSSFVSYTYLLSHLLGCGAQIASGSGQITAVATPVAPVAGVLNGPAASTAICSTTGNVTCVAPTFNRILFTTGSSSVPVAEARSYTFMDTYIGDMVLSPGSALFLNAGGSGSIANIGNVMAAIEWSEIPI